MTTKVTKAVEPHVHELLHIALYYATLLAHGVLLRLLVLDQGQPRWRRKDCERASGK